MIYVIIKCGPTCLSGHWLIIIIIIICLIVDPFEASGIFAGCARTAQTKWAALRQSHDSWKREFAFASRIFLSHHIYILIGIGAGRAESRIHNFVGWTSSAEEWAHRVNFIIGFVIITLYGERVWRALFLQWIAIVISDALLRHSLFVEVGKSC